MAVQSRIEREEKRGFIDLAGQSICEIRIMRSTPSWHSSEDDDHDHDQGGGGGVTQLGIVRTRKRDKRGDQREQQVF